MQSVPFGLLLAPSRFLLARSSLDGLWKISRHEGLPVLWHGVNVSMVISVPAICLYLPLYDHLLAEMGPSSAWAPLAAGALARTVSVVATSPLDLLRTRIQAAGASNTAHSPFTTALQRMRSDFQVGHPIMKLTLELMQRHLMRSLAVDICYSPARTSCHRQFCGITCSQQVAVAADAAGYAALCCMQQEASL